MKRSSQCLRGSGKGAFTAGFVDGLEAPFRLFCWNRQLYSKAPDAFSARKASRAATRFIRIGFETSQNELQQNQKCVSRGKSA